MSHARRVLWTASAGLALASLVACSAMEMSAFGDADDKPSTYGDAGAPPGYTPGDSSAANGPQATGVVLVHAAAFPSFRLCFSNYPDLRPQPDSRVMPEANVVGVEVGTLVRLDPMDSPGTVYVIWEPRVRTPPETTNPPTCGQLIKEIGKNPSNPLQVNLDYHIATNLEFPLGKDRVSVIAITGCGGAPFLDMVDANKANCGDNWSDASGNLKATSFDLSVQQRPRKSDFPVQLFQMSPELAAFDANGAALTVTFGPLSTADAGVDAGNADGGTGAEVPVGGLYKGAETTTLSFDQDTSQIYNQLGFRIDAKGIFTTEQSLASVQDFSAPRDLPTEYYKAASSYALLLLGDPGHKPTLADDAPNPKYNPRRAVHILAVPVIDPEPRDAGTTTTPDGSDPTNPDNL